MTKWIFILLALVGLCAILKTYAATFSAHVYYTNPNYHVTITGAMICVFALVVTGMLYLKVGKA